MKHWLYLFKICFKDIDLILFQPQQLALKQ